MVPVATVILVGIRELLAASVGVHTKAKLGSLTNLSACREPATIFFTLPYCQRRLYSASQRSGMLYQLDERASHAIRDDHVCAALHVPL